MSIDEYSIYDLYSETQENKKTFGSPFTASGKINSLTFRDH